MYIHLNGVKIYAYHGVLPQENKVGAEYILNLTLKTDFSRASQMDDLTYTINYAEVFQAVKKKCKFLPACWNTSYNVSPNDCFTTFQLLRKSKLPYSNRILPWELIARKQE